MTIEVSVIIPAYNTEAYIAQAVASALAQTLKAIEIIVVDDASTDGTLDRLKGFSDQRLLVLVNDQNRGVSFSRNRALDAAQGRWVAVLDSDDWYAPDRLETLLQAGDAEEADIVADDVHFVEDGHSDPWSTLITESGESIDRILNVDAVYFVETDDYDQQCLHLGLSKPLFKREFLVNHQIRYDESISKREDYWFYLECLFHGAKFILVPQPFYYYRSRSDSLIHAAVTASLERFRDKTMRFLDQENVARRNPALAKALSISLENTKRHLAYQRVVEPLKGRRYREALSQLLRNPSFLMHFLSRIPAILNRRFKYYILRDDTAFTRSHLKGKN